MRYRLRTLMIAITALCATLALWPPAMRYLASTHTRSALELADRERERQAEPSAGLDQRESWQRINEIIYHHEMATMYRESTFRPWMLITNRPKHRGST